MKEMGLINTNSKHTLNHIHYLNWFDKIKKSVQDFKYFSRTFEKKHNLWEDAFKSCCSALKEILDTYSERTWDVIITGRQNKTQNMNGG